MFPNWFFTYFGKQLNFFFFFRSKFNAFLASRSISEAERIDIMAQTREVLETLQGKPFVEACDALEQLQDNIQIRDGKAIVRRLLSQQKKMDVEAFPTKILS